MFSLFYSIFGIVHTIFYLYYRSVDPKIDMDLARRTGSRKGVKAFLYALRMKDYRNVFYYRVPLVPRNVMNLILPRVPDCKIQCSKEMCGGGIFVHHGWGTIVLADSIGDNLDVYQNVTVGYGRDGKPTIGNNVKIYSGAVVVGKIRIGNNVRIAANSVVRHDVPDNSLVYGNPCIIKTNYNK